ncbi:E3 ubiquitin-protein ligase RBBP6-like isoform X2 [Platichthys flesus]|uniref:E3 ubiquitin-protein ligase RBBP6-like isoform X2 n=1 Tax=Platichthys flesus TaxID=8260 RepID=UPI002DB644EF|nr:E3 ubiquitin-protein ligase RBBP6-like isoform X2 [Platichthys flesus]
MTHVHYKFSSRLSYDTAVFDGPHITLRDLKKQIMARERLRSGDCDLQITNAQSKQEYTDDEGLIPKGASVIVRRIPIIGGKSGSSNKTHHNDRSVTQLQHAYEVVKAVDDQASSSTLDLFSKMTNLAEADVSEEDKIKFLQNQSAYDSVNYSKRFGTVLPANYTCYRCGNTGHHIRNCPTSGQDKNYEAPLRIKKSSGIPRSFMVEVDDPSVKGAMLTNCGRYAVAAIDAKAYAIGKKEKPPFFQQDKPKSEVEEDPIPEELLCLICHDLLSDAVVIPCCGNSYCDDCIRTTLLDSEEHVCPTCSQSDVSPDTLIANKFLRQAVNNFKKERGQSKSLPVKGGTSQSQTPTPTPSPARSPPPPPPVQSQPQLPQEPMCSHQDSPLHCLEVEDTPALSENPPAATGPTSPCNKLSTSLQTEQSCLETPDREAEGETQDDSAAATTTTPPPPLVLLSDKDPAAAPSQLTPSVEHTTVAEPPPTVTVELQQSPSGPVARHPPPSSCWSGAFPPSGCPPGGWSESQQRTSSPCSAYTVPPPPPLFPSPLFHTYLSAHQSHNSYPPGYPPPATPIWRLPCPQGAPLHSLCSSASTIPALVPKEWYRRQTEKKERSPHRGSTHRHSSSRSQSKSSKSKSSNRSYSSSKSRSRSRSRSQGRSRPRSPYSRHRDLHTRSTPSYSYGYRRSPTPSSSSSPHVGHHSRSKSPSDHRKNRHHSRHHHTKKSASSSYGSARRGERSGREDGGFGASLTSSHYAHHSSQRSGLELETERYLQWKKEYKEWCEKYFNSYVGPFHQLPLPFINLPPPPQWEGSKYHSQANLDSRYRHAARTHGRSPPSQSSSDSRSPLSHSSSDSRSTASHSSSDSRSPPSHTSNNSRSPPSQSSSDSRSTPSEDGAELKACPQQKVDHLPITFRKGSKEVELQETSKDDKKVIIRDVEDLSPIKYKQRKTQKHDGGRGEETSSPAAADSTDDNRKDERGHNPDPHACKDVTLVKNEATFQSTLKPDKSLDKDCVRSREKEDSEEKKGRRRGKDSDSRQDVERRHRMKSSRGADRDDSDRYRHTRGRKDPHLSSEKNRKRKGETPEKKEACKDESPELIEEKKQNIEQKKESKPWPLKEKDIWEGRITVKPQKKISINIILDVKKEEEQPEKQESIIGKSEDEMEKTGDGEEKLNRGDTDDGVNEKKKSSREEEEQIKPDEGEPRQLWEKAAIENDKRGMWVTIAAEEENDGEKKEFDSWHCAPRGAEEEEGNNQMEEVDESWSMTGKEEKEEIEEFFQLSQKERTEGESTCEENRGNLPEGVKTRVRREEVEEMKVTPQRSRNESHHDGPNSIMMDDDSCEDSQEKWEVVKALEENIQHTAVEDQLVLIQIPRSKWEKEVSWEEVENEGEVKAPDPRPVVLPPALVTSTDRETEGQNEQKRQRSVDTKKDRDRQKGKDEERGRSLDRSMAPSSGRDTNDGTWCADRERERGMERGRDRQKEIKRSKERTRDEERGRDRGHSSSASVQKKNLPSSSHFSQHSMSQDTERRGRQQGGDHDHKKSSTSSHPGGKHSGSGSRDRRAVEMPDKHAHKTQRDTPLDPKRRDKHYHSHRESSGSRHQDRAPGTQLCSEFTSLPFSSESSSPKPRVSSPGLKLKQDRSRNESKEAKEWTGNKVGRQAEEEGGTLWRDVDQQRSQELEEGERPSSSSSSASQDGSKDDRRKRKKKRMEQQGEMSQACPEPLEDCELKKHKKKSRRSKDGREEEEGGGEGEDDHAKRCSSPSS